jgi:broad specificity phosphatase PhoE
MTRLILVRHGETAWNVETRRQGRKDGPLNEKGNAQARRVGEYVKASFDVTKVWSSPLQRCFTTAQQIDACISTSDSLLELDYGEWEGMIESEIAAVYPNRYQTGQLSVDPPGGEKRSNLPVRARQFLIDSGLNKGDDQGDVVVVGHSSAMSGLLVVLLGLPGFAMHNFVIDNCSVSTVRMSDGINRLTGLNYTGHLNGISEN